MSLKIIHSKNLKWIDIVNPDTEDLEYLHKNFKIHPLDYQELTTDSQHPKIEEREDYSLLVLSFPVYSRESQEISPGEVDFVIGKDYVITVHNGSMHTMMNMVSNAHAQDLYRQQFMSKNSGYLVYCILESLFKRSFPILDHISRDMGSIEKQIFTELDLKMLEKISLMKRNIIDFRRIMKTHHLILKKLMNRKEDYFIFVESKKYYNQLLEHAEHIWDILAIQKETIDALHDANQSLATNRLNEVTKVMAIYSTILLPATLITFIFGLGVDNLPFRHNPNGFWIILGIAALASAIWYSYFKTKKWF